MSYYDRWLFREYVPDPTALAICRIVFVGLALLNTVPRHLWVADLPDLFFSPPVGPTAFLIGFPPGGLLVGLNIALAVALAGVSAGCLTRTCSLAAGLLMIALDAIAFSTGKIDHTILTPLTLLALAFSGWGGRLSVDAARRANGGRPPRAAAAWPLALLAMTVGLAVWTAGWTKATTGWLDLDTVATRGHLARNFFGAGRETWLGDLVLSRTETWLLEPMDWVTVLVELAFGVAFVNRRLFRALLAMMCLFHLGVHWMFDISFAGNVLVYAVFFLPAAGAWRTDREATAAGTDRAWVWVAAAAVALAGWAVGRTLLGWPSLPGLLRLPVSDLVLSGGAAWGVWVMIREARGLSKTVIAGKPAPAPIEDEPDEPTP